MPPVGYNIFDTALGCCGIAWGEHGVVAVQLPEADTAKAQARLLRRVRAAQPASPPAEVQQAIDGIRSLLSGQPADLSAVQLDMHGLPSLHRRVYDIARTIAPGATLTYGDIANRLGDRSLARAVGQALGRPGGFSAHGGLHTKLRLLMIEGANPSGKPDLFSTLPENTH